ncbi:MAG: ankyrin repeat domain-containing protein [Bacteroidia bacterium]|nr:ankyrin repeat domain-containing protein [Bacteroidia bacterium]
MKWPWQPVPGPDELARLIQDGNTAALRQVLARHPKLASETGPSGVLPLIQAVMQDQPEVVRLLMDHTPQGMSPGPLFIAVWERKYQALEVLLQGPCIPDLPDQSGITPLMYAAQLQDERSTRMLLAGGAHPDVRDPDGDTALMYAAAADAWAVASVLVTAGASTQLRNFEGDTVWDKTRSEIMRQILRAESDGSQTSTDPW